MNEIIEVEFYNIKPGDPSNDRGEVVREKTYKSIYAELLSISQTEFYQAAAAGLKPQVKFRIYSFEYEGNKRLKYNGEIYKIMRTYKPDLEHIELTCEGI